MIVQKIIERYRRKGYDDFWLADYAEKQEGVYFFYIFFLQLLAFAISMVLVGFLFKGVHFFWGAEILFSSSACFVWICLFLGFPWFVHEGIKDEKKKGETDVRRAYIGASKISNTYIKVIRNAPVISAGLLVVCLVIAVILYGIHVKIIIAFVISLLFFLFIARPYHRLLSHVMKEAVYYVDWKTHQLADHFEERYSGYEKWRIPSSEMNFEQFNVWFFRNVCQTAIVSASIGCLAALIYAFSLSPLSCMPLELNKEKITKTEQYYEGPPMEEEKIIQTQVASNEIEKVLKEKPIEPEPDVEETFIREEEEEVEEQQTDEVEAEDIIEPQEEETVERNNNRTECFPLNLLDEMPTMSDGTALSRGVVAYLREQIPELEGKHAYVEFKISPEGEVVEVDASLVYDRELREKIKNSLYSMPNVNPGKKDGRTVYVRTNITVER